MNFKIIATGEKSSDVLHGSHRRIAIIQGYKYIVNHRHACVEAQVLCHNRNVA
jgi:hypothetical protein